MQKLQDLQNLRTWLWTWLRTWFTAVLSNCRSKGIIPTTSSKRGFTAVLSNRLRKGIILNTSPDIHAGTADFAKYCGIMLNTQKLAKLSKFKQTLSKFKKN